MKKIVIAMCMSIIICVMLVGCGSKTSFEGEYLLNVDGYVKAQLKEIDEENFEIYFIGLKDYKSICCKYTGTKNGEIGIIDGDDGKIEIKIENSNKLIVSSSVENYQPMVGTYMINDGTIDGIVVDKITGLDGVYTDGKAFGGIQIDIAKVSSDEYNVVVSGMKDGKFFMDRAKGKLESENVIRIPDLSASETSTVKAKIERLDDTIRFEIESADGETHYYTLDGEYKCMMLDFDFCEEYPYSTLYDGVYGEMIMNIRSSYSETNSGIQGIIDF